jgi:23S rRNA (uracil1939-C5)-methyltransferase
VTIAQVSVAPPPGAFLQAATEADALLAHHVTAGIGKAKRVLDLFCGLGTLSLALARRARVTAVDSDAALLAALRKASNGAQGLKPIESLRRDLFRDPLSPKELEKTDAIVLDPPRAGAAAQCQSIARSKVRRVVMVSCNPATLARDLRALVDAGYAIESVVPIDQFLYTHHLEAVAVLTRK